MKWYSEPMPGTWEQRWVCSPPRKHVRLRLMRNRDDEPWRFRADCLDVVLPKGLTLKEAKAMAVTLWRMS